MISKFRFSVFIMIAAFFTAQPLWAESEYICPEISKAKQVADCPTEDEMKHLYSSTCGTDKGSSDPTLIGICSSYESFMKRKNNALWESNDGEYMGYVSCNVPASKIKGGKLVKIGLSHQGVMDKITCFYEGGAKLTLRTRKSCRIPGAKVSGKVMGLDCAAGNSNCKAMCE